MKQRRRSTYHVSSYERASLFYSRQRGRTRLWRGRHLRRTQPKTTVKPLRTANLLHHPDLRPLIQHSREVDHQNNHLFN